MNETEAVPSLPSIFIEAQKSLAPYIRSREEVFHIRQILAAHLEAQIEHKAGHPRLALLSLPDRSASVKPSSNTLQGLQTDYLKALKANIKVRQEFDQISTIDPLRQSTPKTYHVPAAGIPSTSTDVINREEYLATYVSLIRQRQRQERLRILEDYIHKLEQKAEAATSFLDHEKLDSLQLPNVPAELIISSDAALHELGQEDLKELIRNLEKAVLRAKLQLKNEKQLLDKLKAIPLPQPQTNDSVASESEKTLQALGRTRNELIKWIEEELGKTGTSAQNGKNEHGSQNDICAMELLYEQIDVVRNQYDQYIQARKRFLNSIAEPVNPELFPKPTQENVPEDETSEKETISCGTWVIQPYLQELLSTANEQNSLTQLKSHLMVSLAKQHKETIQAFDRLAHESHLLPMFPLSAQNASRRGHGRLEMDGLEGIEMPSTSHRARAWTYAADMASTETKNAVLGNAEESETVLNDARQLLVNIEKLLGQNKSNRLDDSSREKIDQDEDIWTSGILPKNRHMKKQALSSKASQAFPDIWSKLDGNLGILKMEQTE